MRKPIVAILALTLMIANATIASAQGTPSVHETAKRFSATFICAALGYLTENESVADRLFAQGVELGRSYFIAVSAGGLTDDDLVRIPIIVLEITGSNLDAAAALTVPVSPDFAVGLMWGSVKEWVAIQKTSPLSRYTEGNCELL